MKTHTDPERLLDDVLLDDAGFEAATLDVTLQAVRRRRAMRHRRRVAVGAGVALLALSATVFRPWFSERERKPGNSAIVAAPPGGLAVVSTAPVDVSMLVETSAQSVNVIQSDVSSVTVVETTAVAPVLPRIDDTELFAMLAGQPFAIVRPKGGPAELLLLTSESPGDFLGQ